MPGLSEIDLIRIRHLVEDHAGNHYGGPMGLGRDDAVRYTTDVVLNTYTGLDQDTVTDAVTAILDADPAILNRKTTEKERVAAELARYTEAQRWMLTSKEVLKAAEPGAPDRHDYDDGDPFPYSVACVDYAERTYPDLPMLDLVRETIANRWARWAVRRIVSQAMRVVQAGSQRQALAVIADGADRFPNGHDWNALRREIREYHHLLTGRPR